MEQSKITFVINDNTYSLRATDQQAMAEIADADRQQLIALLEAIKGHEALSQAKAQQAAQRANALLQSTSNGPNSYHQPSPKPERLGSGDADAMMARLVMEEEQKRKPGLTKHSLYKFLAGFTVALIILIVIF